MKHYKARGLYFYEDVWRLGNTTIQRREECCNKGSWKKNAHSWDTPPPPPSLPHQSKQQVARSSVPHSSRPACAVPDCRSVAGHWPLQWQPGWPQPCHHRSCPPAAAHGSLPPATSRVRQKLPGGAILRKQSARAWQMRLLHCPCVCMSRIALHLLYTQDYSKITVVRIKG